eukprot:m.60267 g.60267  ORF g.60267 m.60267 type:complete len:316 (+) comp11362_c0_seq1:22-969(+)
MLKKKRTITTAAAKGGGEQLEPPAVVVVGNQSRTHLESEILALQREIEEMKQEIGVENAKETHLLIDDVINKLIAAGNGGELERKRSKHDEMKTDRNEYSSEQKEVAHNVVLNKCLGDVSTMEDCSAIQFEKITQSAKYLDTTCIRTYRMNGMSSNISFSTEFEVEERGKNHEIKSLTLKVEGPYEQELQPFIQRCVINLNPLNFFQGLANYGMANDRRRRTIQRALRTHPHCVFLPRGHRCADTVVIKQTEKSFGFRLKWIVKVEPLGTITENFNISTTGIGASEVDCDALGNLAASMGVDYLIDTLCSFCSRL